MARFRMIDVECSEQEFVEAVRAVQRAMDGNQAPAPDPAPLAIAPSAEARDGRDVGGRVPGHHAATRFESEASAPPAAKRGRKPRTRIEPAGNPESTITARVLEALKKKPRSSLELATALELEPSQIYGAVHFLKQRGSIQSANDEADGTRRWFLK